MKGVIKLAIISFDVHFSYQSAMEIERELGRGSFNGKVASWPLCKLVF